MDQRIPASWCATRGAVLSGPSRVGVPHHQRRINLLQLFGAGNKKESRHIRRLFEAENPAEMERSIALLAHLIEQLQKE